MNQGFVARALQVVVVAGFVIALPACVRKSNVHLRCARVCQGDSDRCLMAATQSTQVQSCKQTNVACVDACPP